MADEKQMTDFDALAEMGKALVACARNAAKDSVPAAYEKLIHDKCASPVDCGRAVVDLRIVIEYSDVLTVATTWAATRIDRTKDALDTVTINPNQPELWGDEQ